MNSSVWVTTDFSGFHRYRDAPDPVAFLRNWHRHVFKVRLEVPVGGLNREVEFFTLKAELDNFIRQEYGGEKNRFEESCEMIAAKIVDRFSGVFCEVSEDGENGGNAYRPDNWCRKPVYVLPALQKKTRPFVGTEAEGPHHGSKMLFIPGSCCAADAKEAMDKVYNEVWGVYYGAGNDLAYRHETMSQILVYFPDPRITVEVQEVTEAIHKDLELTGVTIVSRTHKDPHCDFYKVISADEVKWKSLKDDVQYVTKIDDPLFAQDKYI